MRRVALAFGVVLGIITAGPAVRAADPVRPVPVASPPLPAAAAVPVGVAVLALPGATDAAWQLATAVYSTPSLRPPTLDDAHARVLCGEPAPPAAPSDVKDLAETVAAVRGDDAPSRALLVDIARRASVRSLLVVRVDAGHATARLFLPDAGAFDAAIYGPDEGGTRWSGATLSLSRSFGTQSPSPMAAPSLATHEEILITTGPPKPKAFYETGWFWGAIGAAAFAGGAIFFATRDNGPTSIHLTVQVPH